MVILPAASVHEIMRNHFEWLSIAVLHLWSEQDVVLAKAVQAGMACLRGDIFYRILEINQGRVSGSQIPELFKFDNIHLLRGSTLAMLTSQLPYFQWINNKRYSN